MAAVAAAPQALQRRAPRLDMPLGAPAAVDIIVLGAGAAGAAMGAGAIRMGEAVGGVVAGGAVGAVPPPRLAARRGVDQYFCPNFLIISYCLIHLYPLWL